MAKKKEPADMTLEELHAEATARELPGRSGMSKEQLVAALAAPAVPASPAAPVRKDAAPSPADAIADELAACKAVCTALARVVRNLGGNPDEVAKQATAALAPKVMKATGPMKRATVTPAGGTPCEVEYPADAEHPDEAAVAAYKEAVGVWHLPETPAVAHGESKKAVEDAPKP